MNLCNLPFYRLTDCEDVRRRIELTFLATIPTVDNFLKLYLFDDIELLGEGISKMGRYFILTLARSD